MIEAFENLVKFILTHKFIRIALNYTIVSFMVLYFSITSLIFIKTKFFYYNPLIVFHKETYLWLWKNYTSFILAFLFVEQMVIWLYFLYSILTKNIKKDLTPKPKEVIKETLEEVMKLWLDDEEIREFYASKEKPKEEALKIKQKIDADIHRTWVNATQLAFVSDIKIFLYETVMPNINFLTTKELQLIIKILTVLQDNKNCPSVTSIYSGDSNKVFYGNHLLGDYTQYKALEEFVPLLSHSLSVAKNTLILLNESKIPTIKKNKMIGQCLICGLAHDLGKIQRFEALSQVIHLSDKAKFTKMLKEKPHHQISEKFLKDIAILEINMDLAYAELLANTVLRHHNPPDQRDKLLDILIEADIKTRNEEKEFCCLKIKEKLALKAENNAVETQPIVSTAVEPKKGVKSLKASQDTSVNERSLFRENLICMSSFSQRDINKNYGLGETNAYLALFYTSTKDLAQEIISYHYQNEREKSLNELEAFIDDGVVLIFYKSSSLARAENILRKLLQTDALKESCIGYIALKNESNIQEAIEKAKEAMLYSQKYNFSITNYANIATIKQNAKKDIAEDDFKNEYLSGQSFKNISQEISQIKETTDANKELFFEADIDYIKSQILNNIAKPNDIGSFYVLPYRRRSRILVEINFLKKIIANLTNCNNDDAQEQTNYFIRAYGEPNSNPRLIYEVSTRKGHYNALYNIISHDGKVIKYPCIPFCAKALSISSTELAMYCNQETLNGIKIELFTKE